MSAEKTVQALAAITDEGLFERLAILREANPNYTSLVHPGVNVAGKTVKSPLDGICFVQGADPPHMIAVHPRSQPVTIWRRSGYMTPPKWSLARAHGLQRLPVTSSRQRSWWRKSGHGRQICVRRWFSQPMKNQAKLWSAPSKRRRAIAAWRSISSHAPG
jgi:hypothetical protein